MTHEHATVGDSDQYWQHESFAVAKAALDAGPAPFGAGLVIAGGKR